jgi:curved DNA-binding protein CbpA
MNLYEVLGLDNTATQDDIKKAYREKAKQVHPDKQGAENEPKNDQFLEIQKSYIVLSDPEQRAKYDQTGAFSDPFTANQNTSLESAAREIIRGSLDAILESESTPLTLFDLKRIIISAHELANKQFRILVARKKSIISLKKKLKLKHNEEDFILMIVLTEKMESLSKEIEASNWKRRACNLAEKTMNAWESDQIMGLKDFFDWTKPGKMENTDFTGIWK